MSRLLLAAALATLIAAPARGELRIGSKNFSESRLLAEIFAQLLEARLDEPVGRSFDLAGTAICFRALQEGEIDVYPEYTGTGLVTLLNEAAQPDPAAVLARVRAAFRERFDLYWLAALGFENSYELAVTRSVADEHALRTISDLVAVAPTLDAAFGYEFSEREDGLVGLRRVYGLEPGSVAGMQQSLKYEAAGAGRIDLLDVYTTDGLILVHDLVVLDDDRGVFPPYEAAPLVRGATARAWPEFALALGELGGLLPEAAMRELNRRVEVDRESIEDVAADFLRRTGLVAGERRPASATTRTGARGFFDIMVEDRADLLRRTGEHLALVGLGLLLGLVVALPLGFWLYDREVVAEASVRAAGLLQTIPSIALLAFMIAPLGIGVRPAIGALFLYAIFPILRNTVTGLRGVDPAVTESARALGMTRWQLLSQVRAPLAAPVILAGVRTAAVISVGTATLAAFIGAGGLGRPIVSGLQLNDSAMVLSGAVPAALLAWAVDALLGWLERAIRPRGV